MRYLALVLLAVIFVAGCTDTPEIIELHPKDAADAVSGLNRPGSQYVDIMPDGSLVLIDSAVSHDQFRAGVAKLVAEGDRCLTVRVADKSPKEAFEFVREVAADTGIQTLEVVRFAAK